jgi:hypothetical protein
MLAGQCRVSQASSALWPGRGKPSVRCARGPSSVSAQKPVKIKKNSFSIFHSVSNIKNLYLNI